MQNHYNLVYREEEREMMPLCCEEGVGVIPWSPIARGFLAGNRKGGEAQTVRARSDAFGERLYRTEGDYQIAERTVQVAQQLDVSSAQVAIAWLLQQEGVSAPIVGASKMHHLDEAVDALSVRLSDENRRFLEEPYQPHPVLGI